MEIIKLFGKYWENSENLKFWAPKFSLTLIRKISLILKQKYISKPKHNIVLKKQQHQNEKDKKKIFFGFSIKLRSSFIFCYKTGFRKFSYRFLELFEDDHCWLV